MHHISLRDRFCPCYLLYLFTYLFLILRLLLVGVSESPFKFHLEEMCVYVGVQLLASQVIFNYTFTIYKFVHCLVEEGV